MILHGTRTLAPGCRAPEQTEKKGYKKKRYQNDPPEKKIICLSCDKPVHVCKGDCERMRRSYKA
jgi:hypothetical protein